MVRLPALAALAGGACAVCLCCPSTRAQARVSHRPEGGAAGAFENQQPIPTDKLHCKWRPGMPQRHTQAVLVSCGSFNPPTYMHLRMFEVAAQHLQQAGFSVVGGYMSPVNDKYGKAGLAHASHRIAMCQLAAADSDIVSVYTWEASQDTAQRSLTVLQRVATLLEDAFGAEKVSPSRPVDGATQPAIKSMLLCGADLLESFAMPGVWIPEQLEEIFGNHGVVCVTRPGSDVAQLLDSPGSLLHKHRSKIHVVSDIVTNTISSSAVRQELQQGRSVRYLIPEEVRGYIAAHGLYGKGSAG